MEFVYEELKLKIKQLTLISIILISLGYILFIKLSGNDSPQLSNLSISEKKQAIENKADETISADQDIVMTSPKEPKDDYLVQLENELVAEISLKMQKLIDAPPPMGFSPVVSTTDGPKTVTPLLKMKTGSTLLYRSYLISADNESSTLPIDWIDMGSTESTIEEVDDKTQAIHLLCKKKKPVKLGLGFRNYDDKKIDEVVIQAYKAKMLPNGRVVSIEDLNVQTDAGTITLQVSQNSGGQLILPDGTVQIGDSWDISNKDENNSTKFIFEGYAIVDGRHCMMISENTKAIQDINIKDVDGEKYNLKVIKDVTGYHYFDYTVGLKCRSDVVVKMVGFDCDNPELRDKIETVFPPKSYRFVSGQLNNKREEK